MEKPKLIIVMILVFAFGLSVGLMTGVSVYRKSAIPAKTAEQETKACWDQAKKRLVDSGLIALPDDSKQEIKSVYGTVESINGNSISLKIKPFDLLADPDLDNRIIGFDSSTKIYRLEKTTGTSQPEMMPSPTDEIQYSGDMTKANLKDLKNKNKNVAPQFNFQSKEIKSGDIKAGDMISVLVDSNIRDSKNIQAKTITLVPATGQ